MNDRDIYNENYSLRKGASVSGGIPTWDILSKWEQTGIAEDINQTRQFHRSEIRDFSCEKPFFESDQQFNGGVDPHTGERRAGGTFSKTMLNMRFGGGRSNETPYNPAGTFIDYDFLDNHDHYKPHGDRYKENYTAGKAGVNRGPGPNWVEYNRQRNFRGKYIKFYNDADPSTVEHATNPSKMRENVMNAQFTGLRKLRREGRTREGRKPGKTPFYSRDGEKNYHDVDQQYREENVHGNYRQAYFDDNNAHNYVDCDQIHNDGKYGMNNMSAAPLLDSNKTTYESVGTMRALQAFNDTSTKKSIALIINTLNNNKSVETTQFNTDGITVDQRKLGVTTFVGGANSQKAIESRVYEIGRLLQQEITNRKLGKQTYGDNGNIQRNSFIDTKVHEYMTQPNRKQGPYDTMNKYDTSEQTGLFPSAAVMDVSISNKKNMNLDDVDIRGSKSNSRLMHYRDDSKLSVNFSNVRPGPFNSIKHSNGEDYGFDSSSTINYKGAQPLYKGLKQAYFSDDMEFSEHRIDNAHRSTARGNGQARRSALTTHSENRNLDDGNMNEQGYKN